MKTKKAIAIHEAGHLVACHFLNINYKYATITPDDKTESLGHVRTLGNSLFKRLEYDNYTPRLRDKVERHCVILLAGGMAERIYFRKKRVIIGTWKDHEQCVELLDKICGSSEEVQAYVNLLYIRTDSLVKFRIKWIDAIAEALLTHKTITRQQAVEIIANVKP